MRRIQDRPKHRDNDEDLRLATRSSLLLRLRDLEDGASWREFFEVYWRLLFNVTRKAGFSAEDAEDIVQQTVATVARKMPEFEYDRRKGAFKGWLMRILRSRMVDHARKVGRRVATVSLEERPREETGPDDFERLWDCEWSKRLVALSLERLKRRVGPKQFQIFHAYMVLEWSMAEVTNTLGVSQRQVYMAKYRVGEKFQEELRAVQAEDANETQE